MMIKFDNGHLMAYESPSDDSDLTWVRIPSERVTCYLNSSVEFDNTTLGDILCLFQTYPILDIVFPRYDFIREALEQWVADGKPREDMKDDGQEDVTRLSIESIVEYEETDFTYEYSESEDTDEDSDVFNFNNYKKIQTELTSSVESYGDLSGKSDSGTSFSMSLTPLRQILHLPVHVPGTMLVTKTRSLIEGYETKTVIDSNKWHPSLFEFISIIIDDLTFYGGESEKMEVTGELMTAMEEIKEIEKKHNDNT